MATCDAAIAVLRVHAGAEVDFSALTHTVKRLSLRTRGSVAIQHCTSECHHAKRFNVWRPMKLNRLLAVLCVFMLTGCQPPTLAVDPVPATTTPRPAEVIATVEPAAPLEYESDGVTPKRYSVTAYGYNYTDLYIDSFEVDGTGGGNLAVSTPTAAGGGAVCCVTLVSGLPVGTEFTIKWTRDRRRWCEKRVRLSAPVPHSPRHLEVHFFQDGHIEVAATRVASEPRLKLDRFSYARRSESQNVNNDEMMGRCRDGYPQQ